MKTQYKHFKIISAFMGDKLWDVDNRMQNYNNHLVTVENTETKKKISFDFWGSVMEPRIKTEQDLLFAFYCFLSDGDSARYGFENFCNELGYDMDDKKSYKIFKACEKSLQKAEGLEIDEEMACEMMNDLSENHGC